MMLKRESDLSEWQKLSEEWEQSGLKQKEYCKGKGISWRAFSQVRTELIMKGLAKPCYKRPKLVENCQALGLIPINLPGENMPQLVALHLAKHALLFPDLLFEFI